MSFLSLNEELLYVQVVHHGQKDFEAPLHLLRGVLHAVKGVWGFHFATLNQGLRVINERTKTPRRNKCGPLSWCPNHNLWRLVWNFLSVLQLQELLQRTEATSFVRIWLVKLHVQLGLKNALPKSNMKKMSEPSQTLRGCSDLPEPSCQRALCVCFQCL